MPIRVSTLRGDVKIKFNAYVRVAGKHILLCREGDSFEGERLARLKGKKLTKMYIPVEQEPSYQAYQAENLERAFDSKNPKSIEIRAQIVHGLLQAASDDFMELPESETLYSAIKDRTQKFMRLSIVEPDLLTHILEIKNVDFSVSHHAVNVAALSLAIAQEMKMIESHGIQMGPMIMGALVHDIEHIYNNINFTVPASELTKPEKSIHGNHAMAGHYRLKAFKHIDPTILVIASQHEERLDGSGPRKIFERDLDLIGMVVAAANDFEHYLLHGGLTPKEALKKMLIEKMGLIHLEAMRGLQEALKKRQIF